MDENYFGIPLWVEKVGRSGGRDHLGLESVGQGILEEITSGLSNITQRARYYSLYCWIIKAFFDSNLKKTRKSYRLFMRKVAFLYTASCSSLHLDDSRTGIDGIDFFRSNLELIISGEKKIDNNFFAKKMNGYNDNNWIYKAKLDDLNLTALNDQTGIPALIEPQGKKLALAFEESLKGELAEIQNFGNWNKKYFEKLEGVWCYHQLKNNDKERQILENIFFARNVKGNNTQRNRRFSFVLFLIYIDKFKNKDFHGFEDWIYRDPKLSPELLRLARIWKILFSRNYLVFSLEGLFLYFLETIRNKQTSFNDFVNINKVDLKNSEDDLSRQILNFYDDELSVFVNGVFGLEKKGEAFFEPKFIAPFDLMINAQLKENATKVFCYSLITLFSLYQRYNGAKLSDEERKYLQAGRTNRISVSSFIDRINRAVDEKQKLGDFVSDLFSKLLIPKHQLVATEKIYSRNLDTFHFQINNGVFKARPLAYSFRPKYNMMKVNEIYNIFEDLDLIEKTSEENYSLTQRGRKIMKEFYE